MVLREVSSMGLGIIASVLGMAGGLSCPSPAYAHRSSGASSRSGTLAVNCWHLLRTGLIV